MEMKLIVLAFAFMLVSTSKVSSMAKAEIHTDHSQGEVEEPIYFSDLAPVYNSDTPMMAPEYFLDTPGYPLDSPMISPSYISESPAEYSPYSSAPVYFSDYPVMAPIYISDPPIPTPVYLPTPPTPQKHIPKHCAVGCVEYCRSKPKIASKRSCQRICSYCCKQCDCIPIHDKPMSCGNWDKIMYHNVLVSCP